MRISGRWVLLLALAFTVAAAGSNAGAQYVNRGQMPPSMATAPDADRPMHHQMMPMNEVRPMQRLGLTEDQRESIAKIRKDAQAARMPLMKQMIQLRTEMQAELVKDQPDQTTVHSLAQQMGDLRTQMQLQNLDQRMAIRNVLTPEQRDKIMMNRHWQGTNERRREAMGMRRWKTERRGAMRGEMMPGCPPGCCMKQGEMRGMRGQGMMRGNERDYYYPCPSGRCMMRGDAGGMPPQNMKMMQKGSEGCAPGCKMMQKGAEGSMPPNCPMMKKGQEGSMPGGCGMMKKSDKDDDERGEKTHSELMTPDDPDQYGMAAPAMMGAGYDPDDDFYADLESAVAPDYADDDPLMVWPEAPAAGQPRGQGQ
jgi:Spy/CpxP family protein refolding chaperone